MKLNPIVGLALIFTLNTAQSQDYKVTWGSEIPKKERVGSFFNIDGKSFDASTSQPGYRYAMTHVEDLNIYNKTIYSLSVEGKNQASKTKAPTNSMVIC